jgi:valyl-tRNA synthetase
VSREDLAIEDRWILSRLAACIAEADRRVARYQFNELANTLYAFFWNDYCDWYVELVKPRLYQDMDQEIERSGELGAAGDLHSHVPTFALSRAGTRAVARQVLAFVLDQTLRLLHPVVPFVTEAIWRRLNEVAPRRGIAAIFDGEPLLIRAAWPGKRADSGASPEFGDVASRTATWRDVGVEREMDALQNVIRALRDTLARINTSRAAAKQPAVGKLPQAVIRCEADLVAGLRAQHAVLERLGRCATVEISATAAKPPESATQVLSGVEIYVPLSGLMDIAAERRRLHQELDELRGHIERLAGKLSNEGFVAKAPPAVVEQERARLAELREKTAAVERNLADLG